MLPQSPLSLVILLFFLNLKKAIVTQDKHLFLSPFFVIPLYETTLNSSEHLPVCVIAEGGTKLVIDLLQVFLVLLAIHFSRCENADHSNLSFY